MDVRDLPRVACGFAQGRICAKSEKTGGDDDRRFNEETLHNRFSLRRDLNDSVLRIHRSTECQIVESNLENATQLSLLPEENGCLQ